MLTTTQATSKGSGDILDKSQNGTTATSPPQSPYHYYVALIMAVGLAILLASPNHKLHSDDLPVKREITQKEEVGTQAEECNEEEEVEREEVFGSDSRANHTDAEASIEQNEDSQEEQTEEKERCAVRATDEVVFRPLEEDIHDYEVHAEALVNESHNKLEKSGEAVQAATDVKIPSRNVHATDESNVTSECDDENEEKVVGTVVEHTMATVSSSENDVATANDDTFTGQPPAVRDNDGPSASPMAKYKTVTPDREDDCCSAEKSGEAVVVEDDEEDKEPRLEQATAETPLKKEEVDTESSGCENTTASTDTVVPTPCVDPSEYSPSPNVTLDEDVVSTNSDDVDNFQKLECEMVSQAEGDDATNDMVANEDESIQPYPLDIKAEKESLFEKEVDCAEHVTNEADNSGSSDSGVDEGTLEDTETAQTPSETENTMTKSNSMVEDTKISNSVVDGCLSPGDETVAWEYRKMLKIGVPDEDVRRRMEHNRVAAYIISAVVGEEQKECDADPIDMGRELAEYQKMLKLGIPKEDVQNKMIRDGVARLTIDRIMRD